MQHINERLPPISSFQSFFYLVAVRLHRVLSIAFGYFGYPFDNISFLFYTLNQRCVRRNNNISQ